MPGGAASNLPAKRGKQLLPFTVVRVIEIAGRATASRLPRVLTSDLAVPEGFQMEQKRPTNRVRAFVSVLALGSVIAVPAAAAPNALERAQEKMRYDAGVKAAAAAKAAAEAKAAEEAAAAKRAQEALAFNPFAPATQAAAAPALTTTDAQSAARQAAIDRLLARVRSMQQVAQSRQNLIMIAVHRGKRSPNGPPESTPRRPFDPPGPPPHVPPGPPQHAPPGPPQ